MFLKWRKIIKWVQFNRVEDNLPNSMTQGEKKRQRIFEKYVGNLNLLIDNGLIDAKEDEYICPICLNPHQVVESDKNPLTLEDAPPKSLGGKANTLTCLSCNNHCGKQIDYHLTERMRELDNGEFIPGTSTRVQVNINGEMYRGEISIDENGVMTMLHSKKNNHPEKLNQAMNEIRGKVIDMNFLRSRVIPEKLEYALLKTGFLLAFEKFGFSLMLNDCYNIIRQQLLNPEERIYPEGFWTRQPFPEKYNGVYFVMDSGVESILAIFQLDTGNTKRTFSTFLPLPIRPIEEVIQNLKAKFDKNGQLALKLSPSPGTEVDYLMDIGNIQAMREWIDNRRKVAN